MKSICFYLFLWSTLQASLLQAGEVNGPGPVKTVTVPFYSAGLQIQYDPAMVLNGEVRHQEEEILRYYKAMAKVPYQQLEQSLTKHRKQLGLNDWFYYELLKNAIEVIYKDKSTLHQTLACWFLLSKAGFDTRLTYINQRAFVYVYSNDGVFEVPMISEEGRTFVNLTSIHHKTSNFEEAVYLLNFAPNKQGRSFGFYLKQLPDIAPQIQVKKVNFQLGKANYQLQIKQDLNIIEMMRHYPIIEEQQYFEVPFSSSVAGSLLPQLRKILQGKSQREALQILVTFTRSAFQYKEDQDYFGRSKPMIADEVFHYPFSDCEDRSALFYSLVKSLLDLPMIIIAYPDHLTIGVATNEPIGKPIAFQGRKYYICDPTGPYNSTEIGEAPREYARSAYEILGWTN